MTDIVKVGVGAANLIVPTEINLLYLNNYLR
jgi:hypothetical protein